MNKWNRLRKQNLGAIPQEASANLNAPEIAPSRSTNKINTRTKPLNFKVSEEFYWQLKCLAVKEKCLMVEVIEKSLKCYQLSNKNQEKNVSSEQLNPYSHVNFTCDKCGEEFQRETAYSVARRLSQLNQHRTFCENCIEH